MRIFNFLLFVATMLIVPFSYAAGIGTAKVNFSGTLIVPPSCSVNNGLESEVSFGDSIYVSDINGVNYMKEVPYQLVCNSGNPGDKQLKLNVISSDVSPLEPAAINTTINRNDFAIKFMVTGVSQFKLNESFVINPDAPPVINAVLIKKPDLATTLAAGYFSASVILSAEYE